MNIQPENNPYCPETRVPRGLIGGSESTTDSYSRNTVNLFYSTFPDCATKGDISLKTRAPSKQNWRKERKREVIISSILIEARRGMEGSKET